MLVEVAGAGGGDVAQNPPRLVHNPHGRRVVRAAKRHQPIHQAGALLQLAGERLWTPRWSDSARAVRSAARHRCGPV